MSYMEITPELLQRIHAWGEVRLASKRWRRDGLERLFAMQYLRWSIALEVGGCPGELVRYFIRHYGPLAKLVIQELQDSGVIEVSHGEAFRGRNWDAPDESLWGWLSEHLPEGYPQGW
jgi:hypothetical protein